MSTTRHKARETAPPRQYQAAIVVPVVVFAFLAGAAAGYSIGRMGRDESTDVFPVSDASSAASTTAIPSDGFAGLVRSTGAVRELAPQPEDPDALRAYGMNAPFL